MYRDEAQKLSDIPEPCQIYLRDGCTFVLEVDIMERSKAQWGSYLNASAANIRDNYVAPINETINYISYFAGDENGIPL